MKKNLILGAALLATSISTLAADGARAVVERFTSPPAVVQQFVSDAQAQAIFGVGSGTAGDATLGSPEISVCAKGRLTARTVSFEEVDSLAAKDALRAQLHKHGCWERLGADGTAGYVFGNTRVSKVGDKEHVDGFGDQYHYDISVAGNSVGAAIRYLTTDTPMTLSRDATVVRSGNLGKGHSEASELAFPDGQHLVLDGIVINPGYSAPVLVDFSGGRKTYSLSMYSRPELEKLALALSHLEAVERSLVEAALTVSFQ